MEPQHIVRRSRLSFFAMLAFTFILAVLLFGATSASSDVDFRPHERGESLRPLSGTIQVTITESGLEPEVLTVTVGTTVVWYNATGVEQELESGELTQVFLPIVLKGLSASSASGDGAAWFSSSLEPLEQSGQGFFGTISPGGTFSHTFDETGEVSIFMATKVIYDAREMMCGHGP